MNKAVYKRYLIKLHGKEYDILIPYYMPHNLWLSPSGYFYKYGEGSDLFGDRKAMKCIRNTFITLAQEPNKIIYFPLENKCPSHKRLLLSRIPQIVFYNHNIQLKRSEWKDILKIINGGFRSAEQYVVYFKFPEVEKSYKNMLHQWKKSKTYYKRKQIKEFFQKNTLFFESDKRNSLQIAVKMGRELARDLEYEAEHNYYDHAVWIGPRTEDWCDINFFYVDEQFIEELRQER